MSFTFTEGKKRQNRYEMPGVKQGNGNKKYSQYISHSLFRLALYEENLDKEKYQEDNTENRCYVRYTSQFIHLIYPFIMEGTDNPPVLWYELMPDNIPFIMFPLSQ